MAVAVDAVNSASSASASSLTFSLTVSGSDRYLLVAAGGWRSAGLSVSSVTYNGVGLTAVTGANGTYYGGNTGRAQFWELVNPDAGTFNVVVTFNATGEVNAGAISFTGVHQTTPSENGTFETDNSITVSSAADDMVADAIFSFNATFTEGAGQTERWEQNPTGQEEGAGSTEPGAASVTMSWSSPAAVDMGHVAVNIKQATGGGGGADQPTMRRWGGVPHMGGFFPGGSVRGGGSWARRSSGVWVPNHLKRAA